MNNRRPLTSILLLGLPLLAAAQEAGHPSPASGGDFVLRQWTVDSGGGAVAGVEWELHGTIGQADAGRSVNAGYVLHGGFALPAVSVDASERLFADGFEATP